MAHTPKPYTLLEIREDGTQVRQYENGDIRDQNGLMITPLKGGGELITPETARAYLHARKAKILHAIEQSVQDVTKTNAPAAAIGAIVAKRAEVAMNDDTRTGNDAAKIVLAAIDAYQDKVDKTQHSTIRNEYVMDEETRNILRTIAEHRRMDTIDVEPTTTRSAEENSESE